VTPARARRVPAAAGRGAFTLVEAILAIAVLVSIAGVVFATILGRTPASEVSAATSGVQSAVATARALAQSDGVAREVIAVTNPRGRVALSVVRFFGTSSEGQGELASSAGSPGERSAPTGPEVVLPEGITLVPGGAARTSPGRLAADPAPVRSSRPRSDEPERDPAEPVSVAVALPDGTVIARNPIVVETSGGASAALHVNRWTGEIRAADMPGSVSPRARAPRAAADAPLEGP
jgi:type II secretory pathway pseudopilin PulG